MEAVMGRTREDAGSVDLPRRPPETKEVIESKLIPCERCGTVVAMAPEDACSADMLVLIRWQGRSMAVPLSQLLPIKGNKATNEAIADWHYWVAQGYCF
jgi:hypothetical protein